MPTERRLRAVSNHPFPSGATALAVLVASLMLVPPLVVAHGGAHPLGSGPPLPTAAAAVAGTAAPARDASASVGSVAYSWDLVNDTTYFGAYNATDPVSPAAMAIDPTTDRLWIGYGERSTGGEFNVTLVDLARHLVVGSVPNTEYTESLLLDPLSNTMFLAQVANLSSGAGEIAFLNATTLRVVHPSVPVGAYPEGMAYDAYAHLLYVADNGSAGVTAINVTSGVVIHALIPTGAGPDSVAYDPLTGDVFVANDGANNVTLLNGSRGQPDGPGLAVYQPYSMTYDPLVREVLVVSQPGAYCSRPSDVDVIDPAIRAVVAIEPTDACPQTSSMAPIPAVLDPISGNLLLPSFSYPNYELSVFEPFLNAFNTTGILTGIDPTVQAVDPVRHLDYVAHEGAPAYLLAINLTSGQNSTSVLLGGYPGSGTYDPANGNAYFVDSFASERPGDDTELVATAPDRVVAWNVTGGAATQVVPIGYDGSGLSGAYAPDAIGYIPSAHALLVANSAGDNDAVVLNATTGAFERYVGTGVEIGCWVGWPCGMSSVAYDPTGGPYTLIASPMSVLTAYYGNLSYGASWYGGQSIGPPGTSSLRYQLLAVEPQNGSVFYLDPAMTSVYEFNLTNLSRLPAEGSVSAVVGSASTSLLAGILFDPLDRALYITDYALDRVYVVDATTLKTLATIPVGVHPVQLALNPKNGWIEVADSGSGNLTLLNGSSVAAGAVGHESVRVLSDPDAIFIDPANGETFVSGTENGVVEALAPVPVVGSFTAGSGVTDVGRAVGLHAIVSGGTGTYQYSYAGLPPGCAAADSASLTCVPQAPGNYTVTVQVTDAAPGVGTATTTLVVNPDPTVLLTPTATAVDGTTSVGFGAVPRNGTPPYAVTWEYGDGGTGAGLFVTHAYSAPGVNTAQVKVTDAAGGIAGASVPVAVGAVLSVVVTRSGNGSASGIETIFNATAVGGLPPFEFRWDFGDNQTLVAGVSGSGSPITSSVAHTFASAGRYEISVALTDGAGRTTVALWNITVVAGPNLSATGPTGASPPFPLVPVVLVVADLAAAVAIGVFVYRGRHRRPR